MRQFFYPSNIAVFGVADNTRNLAKNIISNCLEMGFAGEIYPVGREPGEVYGKEIITNPGSEESNQAEKDVLAVAKRYGIRFIGPNCIGVICTGSGLCTPFNPLQPKSYKKGHVSLIVQSGGVTTQSAYYFSEEHVGFSKIISAGNHPIRLLLL
jgi:acetyltransferase